MSGWSFHTPVIVNSTHAVTALIDNGSNSFALINDRTATRLGLERITIRPRDLQGVTAALTIREVVRMDLDVGGSCVFGAFAYVVPGQAENLILGTPWMEKEGAIISPDGRQMELRRLGQRYLVYPTKWYNSAQQPQNMIGSVMAACVRRELKNTSEEKEPTVFAASMADIEKALRVKSKTDPKSKVPRHYWDHLQVFEENDNGKPPPHREGVDIEINLEKGPDGQEKKPPWGPLYSMSRDELLVLRKTLLEHLDKGYIRASQSPAAAPVLFAKKPGGGLRFCVDYRGLNAITVKDRYPLPLIHETLRQIAEAKWITKLDVRAAFHRIRVKAGDEWKTSFNTRYGLYEWQVMPFGLANGPAVFQRYVNWVLREFLDDFVSAYVDDILIYTNGSLEKHREQVKQVLVRLENAGLQLDVDKCEFETKKTKYLGFIIEAEKGVSMDPAKVEAITSWQAPKTVKGVRSFLGFANFYRVFIENFAAIAAPLVALTAKDTPWKWGEPEQSAFEHLKKRFMSGGLLAGWNPEEPDTVVETDASGHGVGGRLLQRGRPVAFFSRKMNSAERNYPIHDKELLGVIACLKEWYPLVRALTTFTLVTDHKNLLYFKKKQQLSERQVRWSEFLESLPPFTVVHRAGSLNSAADALSRKEEDEPEDPTEGKVFQLWKWPGVGETGIATEPSCSAALVHFVTASPAALEKAPSSNPLRTTTLFSSPLLQEKWDTAVLQDTSYSQAFAAVQQEDSSEWPRSIKAQFADFTISQGVLLCRNRLWVPESEPLRTQLMQDSHDGKETGHPGRDSLIEILRRRFYWPGLNNDVRRFIRNCDICGKGKVWRQKKQGILQPLPVPDRQWQHLSIDFMGPLPESAKKALHVMVITDRLSGNLTLRAMKNIQVEDVVDAFLECHYAHHGPPRSIISDRGPQFVSGFWTRFCEVMKIDRKLSTSWHPQTNGGTERANQEVQAYLRAYVNFNQTDWDQLLPAAMLGLNNRPSSTRGGISPFFAAHGFDVDPIQIEWEPSAESSRYGQAEALVKKIREVNDLMGSALATAQQRMEDRPARPATPFKVGDQVWLSMKNLRTWRPSRKLDSRHRKFTVLEVPTPLTVKLDTPPGIHPIFNVDLIEKAGSDPFPSQLNPDEEPPPLITDEDEEMWLIEEIIRAKGKGKTRKALVKWTGYSEPSWEPVKEIEESEALNRWEAKWGPILENDGPPAKKGRGKGR